MILPQHSLPVWTSHSQTSQRKSCHPPAACFVSDTWLRLDQAAFLLHVTNGAIFLAGHWWVKTSYTRNLMLDGSGLSSKNLLCDFSSFRGVPLVLPLNTDAGFPLVKVEPARLFLRCGSSATVQDSVFGSSLDVPG